MSVAQPNLPGAGITIRILRDDGKTYAGLIVPTQNYWAGTANARLATATGLSAGEQARARGLAAVTSRYPREPDTEGVGWAVYEFPSTKQAYVLRDDGTHLSWGAPHTLFTPQLAAAALLATAGLSGAEIARINSIS